MWRGSEQTAARLSLQPPLAFSQRLAEAELLQPWSIRAFFSEALTGYNQRQVI